MGTKPYISRVDFSDNTLKLTLVNKGDSGVCRWIIYKAGTNEKVAEGYRDIPAGESRTTEMPISTECVDIFSMNENFVTIDKRTNVCQTAPEEEAPPEEEKPIIDVSLLQVTPPNPTPSDTVYVRFLIRNKGGKSFSGWVKLDVRKHSSGGFTIMSVKETGGEKKGEGKVIITHTIGKFKFDIGAGEEIINMFWFVPEDEGLSPGIYDTILSIWDVEPTPSTSLDHRVAYEVHESAFEITAEAPTITYEDVGNWVDSVRQTDVYKEVIKGNPYIDTVMERLKLSKNLDELRSNVIELLNESAKLTIS